MPLNLRLAVLIIALILAVVVIRILHKRMIPVKYSLLWGIGVIILLFLAIWPNSLIVLANLVGFQTVSNMVIGVLLVILFFITMSLTVIVSAQKRKITFLVQEISLFKSEIMFFLVLFFFFFFFSSPLLRLLSF